MGGARVGWSGPRPPFWLCSPSLFQCRGERRCRRGRLPSGVGPPSTDRAAFPCARSRAGLARPGGGRGGRGRGGGAGTAPQPGVGRWLGGLSEGTEAPHPHPAPSRRQHRPPPPLPGGGGAGGGLGEGGPPVMRAPPAPPPLPLPLKAAASCSALDTDSQSVRLFSPLFFCFVSPSLWCPLPSAPLPQGHGGILGGGGRHTRAGLSKSPCRATGVACASALPQGGGGGGTLAERKGSHKVVPGRCKPATPPPHPAPPPPLSPVHPQGGRVGS